VRDGRFLPYLDCCGRFWRLCTCATKGALTIGWGHNLDAKGLTYKQVDALLNDDFDEAVKDCVIRYPWIETLDAVRQAVLAALMFNLGPHRLNGFRKFLIKAQKGDYEGAAVELLDSKRAEQVGDRALREAEQFRTGNWV
jgi:lysozyme